MTHLPHKEVEEDTRNVSNGRECIRRIERAWMTVEVSAAYPVCGPQEDKKPTQDISGDKIERSRPSGSSQCSPSIDHLPVMRRKLEASHRVSSLFAVDGDG
jgi:hypothetical protein